ncbi:uncharacterized protein [Dendrobates tinctorius]|uniref:uncharacterized protein n=1 Tax=Dendrobates tinctorius TaxID=92724 RepID=UPI003CCA0FAE
MARPSFLRAIQAVKSGINYDEYQLEVLYYLEAVLILKHLQRPGVVKNMTVSEWIERSRLTFDDETFIVVGVKQHKTATQQVATFVLDETEENWFSVYFNNVRPKLVQMHEPSNNFFISTTGKTIYNVSNDLRRYHERYKLPNITSQKMRVVCETWTLTQYDDIQQKLFARYLAHSNDTAERSYRQKTMADMCKAIKLVRRAVESTDAPQSNTSRAKLSSTETNEDESEEGIPIDFGVRREAESPPHRIQTRSMRHMELGERSDSRTAQMTTWTRHEESDEEESDEEESDEEESDKEESDKEESDKEESDKEESDKEESDKEESDKEESEEDESDEERIPLDLTRKLKIPILKLIRVDSAYIQKL